MSGCAWVGEYLFSGKTQSVQVSYEMLRSDVFVRYLRYGHVMSEEQTTNQWAAGWYPDGQGNERWWSGTNWTEHVRRPENGQPAPVNAVATQNKFPSGPVKVGVFGSRKAARGLEVQRNELLSELEKQAEVIAEFGISDVVERKEKLDELASQVEAAEAYRAQVLSELADARKELVDVRREVEMQDLGLFKFEHPAEASAKLEGELKVLRSEIRAMNKIGEAIKANYNFTFNDSKAEGTKMVRAYSRLMLRAYNAEAENCVKTVKAGNLDTAKARLAKSRNQIAKTGEMLSIQVSPMFHALRTKELKLAAQHLEAVKAEKEAERERRAELREQRKAEQELKREQERLEKEKLHYLNSIEALRAKGDLEGIARLELELANVEKAIDDVDYRAANIRAGYVYVISNLGAFGKEMVKIGMTRRLDPMDRVRELSDASVPFHFDVHALFFSKDAVGIEAMLHRTFADERVNKVNLRREFFNVTPSAVLEALNAQQVEVIEYEQGQKAPEFRQSWPELSRDSAEI